MTPNLATASGFSGLELSSKSSLTILTLALVIRILAIYATGADRTSFGDAEDYILHAEVICSELRYPDLGNNRFFRAPGLPFFISAVTACRTSSLPAIKVGLAVADTFTVAMIGLLAGTLWRSRKACTCAMLGAAFYPPFVLACTDIQSEPLFMSLLTTGLTLALVARESPRLSFAWKVVLLAGVALGAAALTRPVALVALPVAALALVVEKRADRARLTISAFLFLGAALLLAPWAIRNLATYHEPILVNDAAGINLWRGSTPLMLRIMTSRSPEETAAATALFNQELIRLSDSIEHRYSSPRSRSRAWSREAVAEIRRDPRGYLSLLAAKLGAYWRPWLNPRFHSWPRVVSSALTIVPLMTLGLFGLWLLGRRQPSLAAIVVAFFIVGCLAQLPFQTVMRFRIPFTDPLLIALASMPVLLLCDRWLRRHRRLLDEGG